ncbi:uncharacterized protein LOC121734930 [Aricia agestis]|uniref:uncharacterized protein LOC121734930 n=1 Tax=Aricia agestis TaxID=91739 RepID=UPI001C209317|nr:uncharacterized protein LOC121734930 [Aricia agestis]
MRSQTAKPLTKKGALGKTTFKTSAAAKQTKKKVSPKKLKTIQKSVAKSPKKNAGASESAKVGKDGEQANQDKPGTSADTSKPECSKTSVSRENSPSKKAKKDVTEKKDKAKAACKKVVAKKSVKTTKSKLNSKLKIEEDDDAKYKINLDLLKRDAAKSKAKSNVKKGSTANIKKKDSEIIKQTDQTGDEKIKEKIPNSSKTENKIDKPDTIDEKGNENEESKLSVQIENKDNSVTPTKATSATSNSSPETPKVEHGRPPKFFISSRSPRTVDIDVKCCKNSKGNLSVSERFLSMKCETKNDDGSAKNTTNNLISQGPEIDVYTFTEKVDSPKSILSDFRSPVNKNVGRVRPIARVKGTVINKKSDPERKKYSPHRPIEEVVKQLKAKRSEDVVDDSDGFDAKGLGLGALSIEKEFDESPKPIVSKSYKMVARKSSITGKPFSPIHFPDQDDAAEKSETKHTPKVNNSKKIASKSKSQPKKTSSSDDEIDDSTFSLNKSRKFTSSDESLSDSNDEIDSKESSGSDNPKNKKTKNKKYKRITDSAKKKTSKELKELSKDSLIDIKDATALLGNEKPSKRRLKLLSMWSGPKRHRMASLNAIAKVHCLYENESRSHMELGLMKTVDNRPVMPSTSKQSTVKKRDTKQKEIEKQDSTSESEYESNKKDKEKDSSESSDDSNPPQRTLRGVPGIRSAGKYWDPKSSTSSSDDSELESKPRNSSAEKKKSAKSTSPKSETEKPSKMKKTAGVPVKKKRSRNEVVMDLKDMVVQKRMASLNATAILAASYEKRSPKSSKDDSTSDSCSDESYVQKPKNGVGSGVKSEIKNEEPKKEPEEPTVSDTKQKVEVIVNQDTDVTITGVYSTHHHEGFCTVSGMQYRISSTSHTQTTATANCEKEGCSRDDNRYTPLSALSSMKPPADHPHHPVPELGGLTRRPGCSSAFSAPSPAAHHDPGYYQPAGPLIKEGEERALARYHPPHYHPPHPPVLPQYGAPYYPAELCYGRYYRPPGYHMTPPQSDAPMVGVGSEPYPPQYYGSPPCYQHSPQRIPYMEYRGCPCPLNACPKNVLIGPATGKAPASGGPDVPSVLAPPGAAFRPKVWAGAHESAADTHGSGKDPPLEGEPPMAADAPHPCPLPAIGGASPKREMYDVRENLRLNANIPGPTEAIGPPSPARGACAPQPPAIPRRARLGKAMARRSLAGDDTGLLISVPVPPSSNTSDDDVLAISPPVCAPIDLSSSDERSTPLVDIKKENEGPTITTSRKTDAQALKEHNSTTTLSDNTNCTDITKPVKRRHSRPKLEIDMKDALLLDEDVCKTNGIGEHVKLQKRRKVSGDQTDLRVETSIKEQKKKVTQTTKKSQRKLSTEKRAHKRKSDSSLDEPVMKKVLNDNNEDNRVNNISAISTYNTNPKHKSALLLDNLLKKNGVDAKGQISETCINPAELFLTPSENLPDKNEAKKNLNINNNIVENKTTVNGVRPKTIAAVSQLIGKKLAYKNACKVDSKVTSKQKTVLTPASIPKEIVSEAKTNDENNIVNERLELSTENKCTEIESSKVNNKLDDISKPIKQNKVAKTKSDVDKTENDQKHVINRDKEQSQNTVAVESIAPTNTDSKMTFTSKQAIDKVNGELKGKNVEKLVKLLASKRQSREDSVPTKDIEVDVSNDKDRVSVRQRVKSVDKNGESKAKNVEKVVKLLVSKRTAIKSDEASLVVEDACATPVRSRRRRNVRRGRRPIMPALPDPHDRAPPRWSNGWTWDGDHYLSKVYLNNDSRLDRTARCYSRMSHASGDRVSRGDCVLLRASQARAQPFVARVASLWENPDDGEMMMSLVWYYRPEHTERGRVAADAPDEVFASRHRDANSVACIEDKCYVLTFNEYCRYKKRLKAAEEGITVTSSIVPALPPSEVSPALQPNDTKLPPSVSPELVLFCRKIYDFRSKKIQVPNK